MSSITEIEVSRRSLDVLAETAKMVVYRKALHTGRAFPLFALYLVTPRLSARSCRF